ncbi:MAG: hypothetical protein ACREUT_10565, partial [Steroidobacteraceae bacterium]
DLAWFAKQAELFLEVLAGFPADPGAPDASELTSLIYGRVDSIEPDFGQGLLTLPGRDLTAVFIDTKLTKQYSNQTASQIVSAIASAHGVSANVTTTRAIVGSPVFAQVGTYSLRSTVHLTTSNSEWDLIAWLARESGFVAYAQGKSLYFGPDPLPSATPYLITWQPAPSSGGPPSSNTEGLAFSRSLTVAKGIAVTAQSGSFMGPVITRSYPRPVRSIKPGQASPFGPTQGYLFTMPAGKNAQQVEAFAEAMYREIAAHAMKVHGELPGDTVLAKTMPIRVQGTGTAWDQLYYPRSIVRRMSMEEGFAMEFDAQNSTPELDQAATQAGGS